MKFGVLNQVEWVVLPTHVYKEVTEAKLTIKQNSSVSNDES
jgi:hypothetical protein